MTSAKHARASSQENPDDSKRTKLESEQRRLPYNENTYAHGKLFHPGDFNPRRKDGKLPLHQLEEALAELDERVDLRQSEEHNVLFWMRMHDVRVEDSRGLAHASALVQDIRKRGGSSALIVAAIISPGDMAAHDIGPRKVDFVLRALKSVREELAEKHIPLITVTEPHRTHVPERILSLCDQLQVREICGNLAYGVDELWRDAQLARKAAERGVHVSLLHDQYIAPPLAVTKDDESAYAVFSPFCRKWAEFIGKRPHLYEASPAPEPNPESVRSDKLLGSLFSDKQYEVPSSVEGFECDDAEYMTELWPAGRGVAMRVLNDFIDSRVFHSDLDHPNASGDKDDERKHPRIWYYSDERNNLGNNGTSRISAYLAAGLISSRACLRRTLDHTKRLEVSRSSGTGNWVIELSFREFYGNVLVAWPRVSMGRAFLTNYEKVVWEYDTESLQAWQQGRTGYPIVDAAQRQLLHQGYMHNTQRARMITAMFFTKHLMHDWREGERHFARCLVDYDLSSNNAGWQWCASTGTDPQPYFRIFNPLLQSEKFDSDGKYIRHFVPELRQVKGKAIHDPAQRLSPKEFKALDYPKPIVPHSQGRERALRRYKEPGKK